MSDLAAKKNSSNTTKNEVSGKIDITTKKASDMNLQGNSKEARSKKLDETLAKLSASKSSTISDATAAEDTSISIESRSGLKKLRISAPKQSKTESNERPHNASEFRAQKFNHNEVEPALAHRPHRLMDESQDLDNIFEPQPVGRSIGYMVATATGLFLSACWFTLCGNYIFNSMGWGNLIAQQPHILGGFLAGILAPVALLWMVIAFIQRGSDVRHYSRTLRREMHTTLFANKNNAGLFEKDLGALMGQASEFSNTSKMTLHSIQKARMGLRHDMNNFATLAKEIDSKKEIFDSNGLDTIKGVEEKISAFMTRAEKIEAMLSEGDFKFDKTEAFMDTVQKLIDRSENIDTRLESRMDKLSKTMNGFDEKIKTIEASENKASASLTSLNNVSETSAQNIEKAVETLNASLQSIQAVSSKVSDDVQSFTASTNAQKDALEKVRDSLNSRVETLELTMKEPVEKIERIVEHTTQRHEEMDRLLEKRIFALNETADKAVEKSNLIRTNLRDTVQDMSGFVGRMGGHSKSAYAQMQDQMNMFEKSITETVNRIENAGLNLKSQTSGLSDTVKAAAADLAKLEGNISTHRKGVSSDTQTLFEDLKSYDENIKKHADDLNSSAITVMTAMEKASTRFTNTADLIIPTSKKANAEMIETAKRFDDISNSFDKKTQNNLESLKSINVIFDKTLEDLKTSATETSILLEKSGTNLNQYVDNIDDAGTRARVKVEEAGRLLKDQTDLVTVSADQAVLKIESVQQSLNDQHQDMSSLVSEAKTQIEEAGKEFAKRISDIEGSSVKAISQFTSVNDKAKGQQEYLKEMSEVTNEQINQMVERFKKQIHGLTQDATNALNELNQSSDKFAERNRVMENQIQNSLIASKKNNADISKQMRDMVDSSEKSTKTIAATVNKLSTNMGVLTTAATDISAKVEKARDILETETEHMADVSIKASRLVEEAAQSYQKQSSLLFKASEEAAKNIDTIREKDFKAQRDSFLSNAKYLLESLHSLSVDLTRVLDGRIQEKTWKSYQAGDVAIFTRQIIANKDKLSESKLADKYAKDNEFRTYTNRFIRQFEEVYTNSIANDFGDLLAATFATSDIGKLYEILCSIVAHKNIVESKHTRH